MGRAVQPLWAADRRPRCPDVRCAVVLLGRQSIQACAWYLRSVRYACKGQGRGLAERAQYILHAPCANALASARLLWACGRVPLAYLGMRITLWLSPAHTVEERSENSCLRHQHRCTTSDPWATLMPWLCLMHEHQDCLHKSSINCPIPTVMHFMKLYGPGVEEWLLKLLPQRQCEKNPRVRARRRGSVHQQMCACAQAVGATLDGMHLLFCLAGGTTSVVASKLCR